MRILAWLLAAPVVLWAGIRLGGLDRGYPLVPAVAFTPHVTAASLAVLALLAAMRQWRPLAVAGVATLALTATIVPRAFGGADADGPVLRVMTANATVGRVSGETLIALSRRHAADVLAVQELTPDLDARLRQEFPHAVASPEEGASGTGLYSRRPLRAVPRPRTGPHAEVAARLGGVELLATHPPPPVSRQHIEQWRAMLAGLPRGDRPRVLLGDFNATLDHRELRAVLDRGYADAADATGNGLRATWGRRLGIVIDHVLVTDDLTPLRTEVLPLRGGDHRAVFAVLACATTC